MSSPPAPSSSPCPLCRKTDGAVIYRNRIGNSSILKCPHCTMIWADPVPTMQELEAFYGDEVPDPEWDKEVLRKVWPMEFYRYRLSAMADCRPPGRRVLDVGVGFGHFMVAAGQAEGWEPTGIDISPLAAGYVTEKHGIPVAVGDVRHTFQDTKFDAIHSKDVLEHIPDPVEELEVYRRLLRPGGLLVVETLNIDSVLSRVLGERYGAYIPGHVVYFSPRTLSAAVEKAGFEVIRCYAGDEVPASRYLKALPPKAAAVRLAKKLRLGPVYMASFVLYARVPTK